MLEQQGPTTSASTGRLSFGRLLRLHRERAGLTQQSLAGLSTIGARTIRDLESGRARGRARTVQLLADGLRLSGRVRDQFVETGLCGRPEPSDLRPSFGAPELLTPLVGRDLEVNTLVEALTSSRRRVISLCGLPGVGKTRLAAEIAARLSARYGWPVTWMAPGAVGLPDLLEGGARPDALLVLDDISDSSVLAGLGAVLASWARARVLVTSRVLCHPAGVQPTVLTPLAAPAPEWDAALPPDPDAAREPLVRLGQVPAVRLLVDRLQEVRTGFALDRGNARALVALSRASDGLPLVIELMAARFRVLGLEELARMPPWELLELTAARGAEEVGRSIGDLLGASVDRLDGGQRAILRELAASRRGRTVADMAVALRRSLAELTDDLNVLVGHGLVGHGLVGTRSGEFSAQLVIPGLLRACLRGDSRPALRHSPTRIRGDCVPGRMAASSMRQP